MVLNKSIEAHTMMESDLVARARLFATYCHRDQKRKGNGKPYITHPARVAARVASWLRDDPPAQVGWSDNNLIAAAWLHDVVEDCSVTRAMLGGLFGVHTAALVQHLTNAPKGTSISRAECKRLDRERLRDCPREVRCIKLIDRADNLSEVGDLPPDFVQQYCDESTLLLEALYGTDRKLEAELRTAIDKARARKILPPSDQLRSTLAFFRSVIQSGEPWTAECDKRFREAFGEDSAKTKIPGKEPVPTRLCCPSCGKIHIDEGAWATKSHSHRTHHCLDCGQEWRPFDYPTVGV